MNIREPLTKEQLFKRVSSYDLFRKHCPNFTEVGVFFSSEFRIDKQASARIFPTPNGLVYKDFGENEGCLNIIGYVMKKYNVTVAKAMDIIAKDVNELYITNPTYNLELQKKLTIERSEKVPTILDIKKREFNATDLSYWNNYGWTQEMLIQSKTIPITHFWIDNAKGRRCIKADSLAYSYDYYFHNGVYRRKIYQPKNKKLKWVSNVDDTIVQLVDVMPKKGDVLFITSSKKDAGVFWRINIEGFFPDKTIHGVAPNTETCFVPEAWLSKQQSRWKRIVIWYDNDFTKSDNPGIRDAIKYSEQYNLEYFTTPDNTEKDPSDFVKHYGLREFAKLLESIF